jgi:glycosyl transferase family 25
MKYIILFIITILIIHILSKLHLKYVIRDNKRVTQYTYYINLEHRKDRKEETITELNNFGIDNPIRFNAIKDEKNGHIGCSKSHLAILKEARSKNYPYVMTVEDDIEFMNPDETNRKLNNIINSDLKWDVILLSCSNTSNLNKKINKDSVKVIGEGHTTGYIIKKEYYDTLINHWEEGLKMFIKTGDPNQYACDQYWKILQKKDNFILINPVKVYQRESYSDLVGDKVNYKYLAVKYY